MNSLIRTGATVMVVSILVMAWGYWYYNSHTAERLIGLIDASRTGGTFQAAVVALPIGAVGLVVGLVVTIIGTTRRHNTNPKAL